MKYLVMECHKSYAVVMDEQGCFIKAANLNYKAGETVENILPMQEKKEGKILRFVLPVAAAACICMLVAVWQFVLAPFGTVKIEINPQVLVTSNRIDKVIKVEGINEDGKTLIEDYNYKGKEFRVVTEELTEKAETMGYLKSGGDVTITVESNHSDWKLHAEELLRSNLHIHEGRGFSFIVDGVTLTDHISDEILEEYGEELEDILEENIESIGKLDSLGEIDDDKDELYGDEDEDDEYEDDDDDEEDEYEENGDDDDDDDDVPVKNDPDTSSRKSDDEDEDDREDDDEDDEEDEDDEDDEEDDDEDDD